MHDIIEQYGRIIDYYGDDGNARSERAKAITETYENNLERSKDYARYYKKRTEVFNRGGYWQKLSMEQYNKQFSQNTYRGLSNT